MGNAIIGGDLPSAGSYVCGLLFRIIPKVVVIVSHIPLSNS